MILIKILFSSALSCLMYDAGFSGCSLRHVGYKFHYKIAKIAETLKITNATKDSFL